MQRQRVHRSGKLGGQHLVDHSVALDEPTFLDAIGDDHDLEVRLGADRHVVVRAFVVDDEMHRVERFGELGFDCFLHLHQPILILCEPRRIVQVQPAHR